MTADEYDRYMMNTMPPGTEMARRIIGMDPDDGEGDALRFPGGR